MHRTLLLTLAIVASGCSRIAEPASPPATPAPLAFGFSSYATLDETKAALGSRPILTTEHTPSPARGRCPRFDADELVVSWSDRGADGDLRLSFVNGRLHLITFAPSDVRSYVDALAREGPPFDSRGERRLTPQVVNWFYERGVNAPYVGWKDTIIEAQVEAWIAACA